MGQLEDFRASLKRKDSAVNSEGELPVKSIPRRGMPDRVGHDDWSGDTTSLHALISFQGIPPLSSAL